MLNFTTIGDLSRSFGRQQQTGELKAELERLSFEVTTGRTSDLAKAASGDFLPLNSIEASISRLMQTQLQLTETQNFVETAQNVLGNVQDRTLTAGTNMITISGSAEATVVGAVTRDARQNLEAIISGMNAQSGGRTVFSGRATNSAGLADLETMMADIRLSVAVATTAQDVEDAVVAQIAEGGREPAPLDYGPR